MTGPDDPAGRGAPPATAIASLPAAVADQLPDLTELTAAELPPPLARLGAPPGWQLAQVAGDPTPPARMLVCGQRPDGSWEGCDTVRAFTFTGHLDLRVVYAHADCTLRSLTGQHITAGALAAPPHAVAARSAGYFTAGRRFAARFTTYAANPNPTPTDRGLLIEHSAVTDADRVRALRDDIINLSNAVHHAFLAITGDPPAAPAHSATGNAARHFRYDTTGLLGTRMRLISDPPTNDAGDIQHALTGVTDVICLDDTPSVLHDLRVHPVGRPDTVASVEFTQLARYDHR